MIADRTAQGEFAFMDRMALGEASTPGATIKEKAARRRPEAARSSQKSGKEKPGEMLGERPARNTNCKMCQTHNFSYRCAILQRLVLYD